MNFGYYEYENGKGAACRCRDCRLFAGTYGTKAYSYDWRYYELIEALVDEMLMSQIYVWRFR